MGARVDKSDDKVRKAPEKWQLEDARRLRDRWDAVPAKARGSQEAFAAKHGLGTQGNVWQYLQGRIPLNLAAAIKFAKGLGCEVKDISPTLAKQLLHTGSPTAGTDEEFILETMAIKTLRKALPAWRRYVLNMALTDSHTAQQIFLDMFGQAVSDEKVGTAYGKPGHKQSKVRS